MKYPMLVLFLVVLVMRQSEGSDITQEVKRIVAEKLGIDINEVNPSSNIRNDLQADDLAVNEIILAIEEEFHEDISDENAEKFITVNDIIQYITTIKSA